jgi:hypothetical protein
MSIYDQMRTKLEVEPSRHFDQRMRQTIDRELGIEPHRERPRFFDLRMALATAVAASLVFGYLWLNQSPFSGEGAILSENIEFLRNMETLGAVDDEEDLISASEEEWALALEESES